MLICKLTPGCGYLGVGCGGGGGGGGGECYRVYVMSVVVVVVVKGFFPFYIITSESEKSLG